MASEASVGCVKREDQIEDGPLWKYVTLIPPSEVPAVSGRRKREIDGGPLWKYATILSAFVGRNAHIWKCNVCGGGPYRGTYTRVKGHLLCEGYKGIVGCPKSTNTLIDRYEKEEQEEVDAKLKEKQAILGVSPSTSVTVERVVGSRKRGYTETTPVSQISDLQGTEEVDAKVARCIYACGLPLNVVCSPYWQDMIQAINGAPKDYVGPTYEQIHTTLLQKEKSLLEGRVEPIRSDWKSSGVSIAVNGWTGQTDGSLINIFALSRFGAIFLKAVDCTTEIKDSNFIANVLGDVIESIGADNVVQVITDNNPLYKAAGMLIEGWYQNIFWTPCIVHSLNSMLEEMAEDEGHPQLKMIREVCKRGKFRSLSSTIMHCRLSFNNIRCWNC